MRETFVVHSRLSWRQIRGTAAINRRHGLQALAIEHLAARLAGGFVQPIDTDTVKEAIGASVTADLGEFNEIKSLPGFPRAAAATLQKAWTAGIDLAELGKTTDQLVSSRIQGLVLSPATSEARQAFLVSLDTICTLWSRTTGSDNQR